MRAGGHARSEVEYMHKRRAESILTDFQFWQTVAVQKRPKPRAAVIFWARQLIVQCGLYCNTGKLVLLPMKLSCSSIGWRSSEGGRVWKNSSRRNDGPSCCFPWLFQIFGLCRNDFPRSLLLNLGQLCVEFWASSKGLLLKLWQINLSARNYCLAWVMWQIDSLYCETKNKLFLFLVRVSGVL